MTDPRQTDDESPPSQAVSSRASKLVGLVISGRYRIDDVLAVGGMGVVYRGSHVHMRKRVAVKVLLPETKGLPNLVTRFEREAIVGAHINHTNIASATDFGQLDDGSYFLVQEFARGITLSALIKQGPVAPLRAARITRQLAAALDAAHQMGVLHRDLKPRNVMVDDERGDFVKLIDFGLAKVPVDQIATDTEDDDSGAQELTTVGVVFGTVAYMSPEAGLGMWAVDERSDLYALGMMLYEMLAGAHPFEGADPIELFRQQRMVMPRPIADRSPGVEVPPALEAIVMKLVAKDPDARIQTAKGVIEAIDEAMPLAAVAVAQTDRGSGSNSMSGPASSRGSRTRTPIPSSDPGSVRSPEIRMPALSPEPSSSPRPLDSMPSGPSSSSSSGRPPQNKPPVPTAKPSAPEAKPPVPPAPGRAATSGAPSMSDAKKTMSSASDSARASDTKKPAGVEADSGASSPSTSAPAISRSVQTRQPSPLASTLVSGRSPGESSVFVPMVPVRNKSSHRSSGLEWFVRGVAVMVILTAGVVFFFRGKLPVGSTRPGAPLGAPGAATQSTLREVPAPSTAAVGTETTGAPASTAALAPSAAAAGGSAGATVQSRMRAAAEKQQWDEGADALIDLAKTEPQALKDQDTAAAATSIAMGLAPEKGGRLDKVFEALSTSSGTEGLDVLYAIAEKDAKSEVSLRALEVIAAKDVLERTTPALRVAVELRHAPCLKKVQFFTRAKRDGDQRAAAFLESTRAQTCNKRRGECCFQGNTLVDSTIRAIKARSEAAP